MYENYEFNGNERPFIQKKNSTYWMVLVLHKNADKVETSVGHNSEQLYELQTLRK
jgi:hypothetical protein